MTDEKINNIRAAVFKYRPLIHCITNPISITQCANAVLAVGARPIMAEHPKEVKGITKNAKALLINLGNITDVRMKSMKISMIEARKSDIPIVIDAVGVACSELRRRFAKKLIKKYVPSVVKGNYSEIKALYDEKYTSSGVDTEQNCRTEEIIKISAELAKKYKTVILASGKEDIIADGSRVLIIKNGTHKLSEVTGTGCMLGALCACFLAVSPAVEALVCACAILGYCGERTQAYGMSFLVELIDKLSDREKIYLKLEERKFEEF